MLVMKFGGTSLKNADLIDRAARIVADRGADNRILVVVSALGDTTDRLEEALSTARDRGGGYEGIIEEVLHDHRLLIRELFGEGEREITSFVEEELERLKKICQSISVLGELTPKTSDGVVSLGERFMSKIFSKKLSEIGVSASPFCATELIVTDDNFGSANPLTSPTRKKLEGELRPALNSGEIPVVTGFIGATEEGIPTTLGRGGSDYTATLLGNLLGARSIWIWTDVDGVKQADPAVVEESETLPKLTYEEAAELSYFGARVIHPRSIAPAAREDIPVRIKNTSNPAGPDTIIEREGSSTSGLKSVTFISELALITVKGHGMIGVPGIAADVFSAVAQAGANVLMISQSSSEQNITFLVPREEAEEALEALGEKLRRRIDFDYVEGIKREEPVSIVAAVGADLRHEPGVDALIFSSLAKREVNVISIAQGSSEHNLSFVVEGGKEKQAVEAVHECIKAVSKSSGRSTDPIFATSK